MRTDSDIRSRYCASSLDALSRLRVENGSALIDAEGMYYRDLNGLLRRLDGGNVNRVEVYNVYGQRYIGTGLNDDMEIRIYGTPGNDLGAFMNGPSISVYGNAQDGCGNTMNSGLMVVHGHAGDVVGYSMRRGKIFIRDDVGYRAGIHMKEYRNVRPFIVVGGSARDFLGEYMAGGVILVLGLGLKEGEFHKAKFVGAGMHGGVIYARGGIANVGKEAEVVEVDKSDVDLIRSLVKEFCGYFSFDFDAVMRGRFVKVVPVSHRPYGRLYAY